jgi:hypothetical protein
VSKKGAFESYCLESQRNSMVSGGLTSLSSAEGVGAREGTVVETDGARLGGISRETQNYDWVFGQMSSAKPMIRE